MSYSRWSNSIWYTYWGYSVRGDSKENQLFVMCDLVYTMNFTYKELVEDMEGCIQRVLDVIKTKYDREPTIVKGRAISNAELDELRGYMSEFIQDMDKEYQ